MPKLVNLVPRMMFERFNITTPEEWEVVDMSDPSEDELTAQIIDADFLFIPAVRSIPKPVIDAANKLKLIQSRGIGYNGIDLEAASDKGIYVCNTQGSNAISVAEHAIGFMLSSLRRMAFLDSEIHNGRFLEAKHINEAEGSHDLASRHVGLLGIGAIGKMTAKRLQPFGCKVSYYDELTLSEEQEEEYNVSFLSFDELIRECDILSIHVPVLPSTRKMISWEQFKVMKPSMVLINTARGEIVDEDALADALETGKISGAALDTFDPEPPKPDGALFSLSKNAGQKILFTPHIAGVTDESYLRIFDISIGNMIAVCNGEKPKYIVNGL